MGVRVRERVKGSGEWWIFINHNGRRKSKKIGSKKLARQVAERIRAGLVLGQLNLAKESKTRIPTLKSYAKLWLAVPHGWTVSTKKTYDNNLRLYLLPRFGHLSLDQIKRKELKDFFNRLLTKGLAPATVKQIRGTISSLMSDALDSELIESNPVLGIKIQGNAKKTGHDVDPLTDKEAERLLAVARGYQNGIYYPPLLCALRTGMRIGELEALRWEDIDFSGRFIEVRHGSRKRKVTATKNKKRRRVDMSPVLANTLKALRTQQKKAALKDGRPVPDWVFANSTGNMMHRETFTIALHKCLEKAELRRIRVHDLRHSYATIRLMRGHNIGDVSYQLGHSSIQITYDVYGHWIPGQFKNEVDELDGPHISAPYTQPGKEEGQLLKQFQ